MNEAKVSSFSQLVETLARLRGSQGCPWDREQTHNSLERYLLEECYEVMEAIDVGDAAKLSEELGDVLLQVLFHAQIASEASQFTINDVAESVLDKLVRRHPHVFGDATVKDAKEVEANWERLKREERQSEDETSLLGRVPKDTPALAYSQLIQDRASKAGFDWVSLDGVLEKVVEEVKEIQAAASQEAKAREFGDLLLAMVNAGRWMGIHTEDALRQANARFARRFAEMERLAKERGTSFTALPMQEKETLWQEAKARESGMVVVYPGIVGLSIRTLPVQGVDNMLSKQMEEAVNQQIHAELYSAYLYLSMSAYFEAKNLPGFARWMRVQNQEETEHAMKFFDFLTDRGGRPVLHAIAQPPAEFLSTLEVMEQILGHERKVTAMINQLYGLAVRGDDYPLQVLLHWFITEQVEEEKTASIIIEQLKLVGDSGTGILILDSKLGERGKYPGVREDP